jgi:hypothetical protein
VQGSRFTLAEADTCCAPINRPGDQVSRLNGPPACSARW